MNEDPLQLMTKEEEEKVRTFCSEVINKINDEFDSSALGMNALANLVGQLLVQFVEPQEALDCFYEAVKMILEKNLEFEGRGK